MNRYEDIIAALAARGITAYAPAEKRGICAAPYCVVRQSGANRRAESRRGGYCRYRIYIFVPIDRYSLMDSFAEEAREALRPLEESGALRLDRPRSETAIDDEFRAHTCFIEFVSEFSV